MGFTPSAAMVLTTTIELVKKRRKSLKRMRVRSGLLAVRVLGRGLLRRCAARGTNPSAGDRSHDAQALPATLA